MDVGYRIDICLHHDWVCDAAFREHGIHRGSLQQISFRYEGDETIVVIRHVYLNRAEDLGDPNTSITGTTIELEVDGEIRYIEYCQFDPGDPANTTCQETEYLTYPRVEYNLGTITGTPPKVRSRARGVYYPMAGGNEFQYTAWTPLLDAVVPRDIGGEILDHREGLDGSTVTGSSMGRSLNRVMHINRGIPLISAEHDPHFPALQFQRQARSFACSAWIWCTASSTTMPSENSVS